MLEILGFSLLAFAVGVGVGHWAGYAKARKFWRDLAVDVVRNPELAEALRRLDNNRKA